MAGIRESVFLARCPGSWGANPIIFARLHLWASSPAMAALQGVQCSSNKELPPSDGHRGYYTGQGLGPPALSRLGKCPANLKCLSKSSCRPNKI